MWIFVIKQSRGQTQRYVDTELWMHVAFRPDMYVSAYRHPFSVCVKNSILSLYILSNTTLLIQDWNVDLWLSFSSRWSCRVLPSKKYERNSWSRTMVCWCAAAAWRNYLDGWPSSPWTRGWPEMNSSKSISELPKNKIKEKNWMSLSWKALGQKSRCLMLHYRGFYVAIESVTYGYGWHHTTMLAVYGGRQMWWGGKNLFKLAWI